MKNLLYAVLGIVILFLYSCDKNEGKNSHYSGINPIKNIVFSGLNRPWSICFLSEYDVLITEKDGDLVRVNLTEKTKSIIKGFPNDLADGVEVRNFRGNSGIFEVIKHPDYSQNGYIYISYAAQNEKDTTTKIIRAILLEDELKEIKTIFTATPYSSDLFHYGGGMVFGQDGKLYFMIGERLFNEKDAPSIPIAQNILDKRGKIYRLNDDGTIPNDNPNFGKNAIPGIYALGIRAAQGITVNPNDGSIWFSEHGPRQGDELNLLKAGANYGWPVKTTGKYRNSDYAPPKMENTTFTEPFYFWSQTIAPAGLIFYTGDEFPDWNGDIILSGLSRGSLWRINMEENKVHSIEELFINDRVRSRKVAMSPQGKLFLLTDEKDGKLIEIKNAVAKKD